MGKIDGGLRSLFRGCIPTFHWTSIETGGTAMGVADSNYLARGGIEGWIEFKRTQRPTGYSVKFQTGQAAWLHRRARLGGRAWLAVRRGEELWMVPGAHALIVQRIGLERLGGLAAGVWAGDPARWDWAAVADMLRAAPVPFAGHGEAAEPDEEERPAARPAAVPRSSPRARRR